MGCTTCRTKSCRTEAKDCFGIKELSLSVYSSEEKKKIALTASSLIDNGRAGTLSRLQEILEYAHTMGYERIGVAYCFGLPDQARDLENEIKDYGLYPIMVQCTAGGVKEKEIDASKTKETVSCNPAGQAITLEQKGADFVIEVGLCMGHDVIFHQTLNLPHTTFMVKDRVYLHNPAAALEHHKDLDAKFLETMDDSFRMISPQNLLDMKKTQDPLRHPLVLDLRGHAKFLEGHIPGSINIELKSLPSQLSLIQKLVGQPHRPIVAVCNGSVQSAYAIMFLHSRAFKEVYNLSGGIGRWEKEMHELEIGEADPEEFEPHTDGPIHVEPVRLHS